ncbi:MAG: vitamin K epoxide reductase family protein [Armatimonadetes bacterium]|nr:vitamin K epoxide reductase family protein [Armatimonadota bacterium]
MARDPIRTRRLLVGLAAAGLAVTGYLALVYSRGTAPVCIGSGCAAVAASPYARLAGVPISYLGVAFYGAVLVLAAAHATVPRAADGLLALSLAGVIFSAYLTYAELFLIRALCVWCVASAAIVAGIFLLSLRSASPHTTPAP